MEELFWIFSSKVPQKHLFSASWVLKKAQNRHKLKVFNPLHILGCFFWRLMMMLCCPSLCLSWTYGFQSKSTPKTPFSASEGLKRTHNRHKLCNLWNAFFGWLCPSKAWFLVQEHPYNIFLGPLEALGGLKIYPNLEFLALYPTCQIWCSGSKKNQMWHKNPNAPPNTIPKFFNINVKVKRQKRGKRSDVMLSNQKGLSKVLSKGLLT